MTVRRWATLATGVLVAALAVACAAPATTAGSSSTTGGTTGASAATAPGAPSSTEVPTPSQPAEQSLPDMTAAALPDCTGGALPTASPGTLTIATGRDPRPPWFTTADPATADGYEAQVAHRVAAVLGYPADKVSWMSVDTPTAVGGDTDGFDLLIDRVRETPEAAVLVDFSSGYYSITDAVLMPRAAAPAGGLPSVGGLRLGVVGGGTGALSLDDRGLTAAEQFGTSDEAVAAVASAGVQAVVIPTPDAIAAAQSDLSLVVAGQVEPGKWQPDQFHLVLAKDSPLTPCVSAAVDRLRIEGDLDTLTQAFITGPLAPMLPF